MSKVMVSVFCLAHNHEKYIRNTLESFVAQKTTFEFEVLVHDDASTDGTAGIIREYAEKYPTLIRPVYQTENQYSKGVKITSAILLPMAKGKYIAFCEGDDYWPDHEKLQKQFVFMEEHPAYSICTSRALKHWCTPGGTDSIGPAQDQSRDYSLADIASREHFFAWASVFTRTELFRDIPECFCAKTCGDIPYLFYAAIAGKFHCLQDVTTVYNYRTESSFTRAFFNDHAKKIAHNRDIIDMLHRVDAYYKYQYTDELSQAIRYHEYHLYKHTGEWDRISGEGYQIPRERDLRRLEQLKKPNDLTDLKT